MRPLHFPVIYLLFISSSLYADPEFTRNQNWLGNNDSSAVAVGDLDGDGDLDAFVSNYFYGKRSSNENPHYGNTVWINNGKGEFTDSKQRLGSEHAQDVKLADFDNDGDLDAFVANYGPNTVWINNGCGEFVDSGLRLGDGASESVSLGDLDGDGDIDAYVANRFEDRIWLNSSGRFVTSKIVPDIYLGTVGIDSALADVDKDGDLDAIASSGSWGLEVFLNDGSGNLSDTGFKSSGGVGQFAAEDVDGDKDIDIVSSLSGVLLNTGNGTFVQGAMLSGLERSLDVALADVDNDGDLDVYVAMPQNSTSYYVPSVVYLNNGNGEFDSSDNRLNENKIDGLSGFFRSNDNGIAFGDFDIDGDVDIFRANGGHWTNRWQGQANAIYLNDGNGSFHDNGQVLGRFDDSIDIALGDIDSDGDLDAYVAGCGKRNIDKLVFNQGNGVFKEEEFLVDFAANCSDAVTMGDVDGDNDLDLVLGALGSGTDSIPLRIYLNNGGSFVDSGQRIGYAFPYKTQLKLVDIDNDNDLDLFQFIGSIHYWINDGNGSYSEGGLVMVKPNFWDYYPTDIEFIDYDEDGDLDIIVTGWNSSATEPDAVFSVWENDGNNQFTLLIEELDTTPGVKAASISIGDLNGNGKQDIVVLFDSYAKVWLNQGSGNFVTNHVQYGTGGFSEYSQLALADVENDGDLDLFINQKYCSNPGCNIQIWLNDGTANFTTSNTSIGNSVINDFELGDLDQDGKVDIFMANGSGVDGDPNMIWLNRTGEIDDTPQQCVAPTRHVGSGGGSGNLSWYFLLGILMTFVLRRFVKP